jgi:hypothetical protein
MHGILMQLATMSTNLSAMYKVILRVAMTLQVILTPIDHVGNLPHHVLHAANADMLHPGKGPLPCTQHRMLLQVIESSSDLGITILGQT